jgi:hypothetical protein
MMIEEIKQLLEFCGDALLSFAEDEVHEVVSGVSGLYYNSSLPDELHKIVDDIYVAEEVDQIYDTVEEILLYCTPKETEQILKTAKKVVYSDGKTCYICYRLTKEEVFDRCLLLLQKQTEIEPPKPLPSLGKYDEEKHPYYRLCGDLLLFLARATQPEEWIAWAEQQLSGRSARYADMDATMRDVLQDIFAMDVAGFALSEKDIFAMCMKLLQ